MIGEESTLDHEVETVFEAQRSASESDLAQEAARLRYADMSPAAQECMSDVFTDDELEEMTPEIEEERQSRSFEEMRQFAKEQRAVESLRQQAFQTERNEGAYLTSFERVSLAFLEHTSPKLHESYLGRIRERVAGRREKGLGARLEERKGSHHEARQQAQRSYVGLRKSITDLTCREFNMEKELRGLAQGRDKAYEKIRGLQDSLAEAYAGGDTEAIRRLENEQLEYMVAVDDFDTRIDDVAQGIGDVEAEIQQLEDKAATYHGRKVNHGVIGKMLGEQAHKVKNYGSTPVGGMASAEIVGDIALIEEGIAVSSGLEKAERRRREMESQTPTLYHADAGGGDLERSRAFREEMVRETNINYNNALAIVQRRRQLYMPEK